MNLKSFYKAYKRETQGNIAPANSPVKKGGIYFGTFRRKPFWFTIVDQVDDLYECMKASDWVCFHSSHNLLVDIGMVKLLVEPANSFWLTPEEISTFNLIHTLDDGNTEKVILIF